MTSEWNNSNVKRDVNGTEQRYYHTVMYRMSKDSKRQWTHSMNKTLWRNLGLFPFSIFGLVLNRATSD